MKGKLVALSTFFIFSTICYAQNIAIKHFVNLDEKSSCYIEARKLHKVDDSWEITLSNFTLEGIEDTTFNHRTIDPDSILKVVLSHTNPNGFKKLEDKKSYPRYNAFLNEMKSVAEKMLLSYTSEVMAGTLTIIKNIPIYKTNLYKRGRRKCDTISGKIEKVELYFSDGFIDNISVIVKTKIPNPKTDTIPKDTILQFKNYYPIGISTKKNLDKLKDVFLRTNRKYLSTKRSDIVFELKLTDFFKYQFAVEKNQYDVSPLDTLIKFQFIDNKSVEIISLKKEDKNKIFEIRTFTDFVGISEDAPNGLIQIEAQRKIKLYTNFRCHRFPIGFLHYIEPNFRWNKIEKSNAVLLPVIGDTFNVDSTTQNGITTANYNVMRDRSFSTLDLFRYQEMSFGLNMNFVSGFNSNWKLKYTIDGILNFGRTRVRDSVTAVDTTFSPYKVTTTDQAPLVSRVNTFQWGVEFNVRFFPDARYGFSIGAKYLNVSLLSMDYSQFNRTYQNKTVTDKYINQGIFSSCIQVHKNFDNDSKFYIRYAFNSQVNNLKYSFTQFQVGYNAYLKFDSK